MTRSMEEIYQALSAEREVLAAAAAVVIYPAPEVSSRDPWPEDFVAPGPTVQLRTMAESHGWRAWMTYSRGHYPHGTTGEPTVLRHTVAVRMAHAGTEYAAYAIYASPVSVPAWKWESIMLWGANLLPFPYASVTDAKEWIKVGGRVPGRWYSAIRRREEARRKAKRRPVGSGRKKGPMS